MFDRLGTDRLFMKAWQGLRALYNRGGRRDQVRQLDELLEDRADRSLPGASTRNDREPRLYPTTGTFNE